MHFVDESYWPLNTVLYVKDFHGNDPRFVYYLLMWFDVARFAGGTGVPTLNRNAFSTELVEIPSVAEQQRLACILDEAYSAITASVERAEASRRGSWEIFERFLDTVFRIRGREWGRVALQSLCTTFKDGDWIESKDQSDKGIRLVQTGNIGVGVFKDREDKARFISEATFDRLRCTEVFPGDCLISRLPDPVGRCCVLPEVDARMITAVDCTIVRCDASVILPSYLVYFSQSREYLNAVASMTTGTTRSRISRTSLGLVPIAVAPRVEQLNLIAELDDIKSSCAEVSVTYQRKLTALDDLKQSILHCAFSGQL